MVASPVVNPSAPPDRPTAIPPSPSPRRTRRPRWLDLRLVVGVVLVLGSVLLGAVVVSRAAASTAVWSLQRDLAAGSVLAASDLVTVDVRLGDAADRYVPADRAVVGTRLAADVGAGQLLPVAAIAAADDSPLVTVAIPFDAADAPTIERGDRITVWLSTPTCASVVLLPAVGVQDARAPGSGLTSTDALEVVVSVSPELADRVVAALALDSVTLRAGVLSGPDPTTGTGAATSAADLPSLAACGAAGAAGASATPSPTAS